jgi:hypothetical protein
MYDLVGSEETAQELIDLCQKKFQGVLPLIRLQHCIHGQIIFSRRASFNQHKLDDRASLIEEMKDWDFFQKHVISLRRLHDAFYSNSFYIN